MVHHHNRLVLFTLVPLSPGPTTETRFTKGTGRVFCAGQDLKGWLATSKTESQRERTQKCPFPLASSLNSFQRADRSFLSSNVIRNFNGFASIARRRTKKPLIAALNGHSFVRLSPCLFQITESSSSTLWPGRWNRVTPQLRYNYRLRKCHHLSPRSSSRSSRFRRRSVPSLPFLPSISLSPSWFVARLI